MYNYLPAPYCPYMQFMRMDPRTLYWQDITYNPTTQLTKDIKNEFENNLKTDTREDIKKVDNEISDKENTADLNTSSLKSKDNMTRNNERVNNILSRIEKEDPMVIRALISYGIPDNITADLIRRIIPLIS